MTFAPRSCPSRPGLAIRTRIGSCRLDAGCSFGGTGSEVCGRPIVTILAKSLSVVLVETFPGFAAELAGGDETAEEWCRPVLVVAEVTLEDFEDVEAGIESDQVGEGERSHRVSHAELHHLVDRRPIGDA